MRRIIAFSCWLLAFAYMPVMAQRILSLDSCRAMALRNNKQLSVSRVKQEVAKNIRKSARTKYLPHVSALGGYIWNSEEASILTDDQKSALSHLGSNAAADVQAKVGPYASILPASLQAKLGQDLAKFSGFLDHTGQGVVDAFRTDTRNAFGGAVIVTQPDSERAEMPEQLLRSVRKRVRIAEAEPDRGSALARAFAAAKGKILCCTGSLYLIGDLRERIVAWKEEAWDAGIGNAEHH